jgi:hypothetical protein
MISIRALWSIAAGDAVGTVVGASAAAIAAIGTSIVIPGLGWVVAGAALRGFGRRLRRYHF